ncbi:MAG: cadherin-like domain-containing protein, partial [Hyphomicrobiaceae bacterium]
MRPTRDQSELNDDGTPRRKYELDDEIGSRMVLRGTIAIAFANAIVLAKNVLFGEPARNPYPQSLPDRPSPERFAADSDGGSELVPPDNADTASDPLLPPGPATGFARLLYTSSGPLTQSGQPAAPLPHPLSGLVAAGNDNVALYGARPGAAISSFAAEVASSALFVRGDGGGFQGGGGPARQLDVDVGDDDGSDDDDDDAGPDATNRSPVVSAPILLGSLMTNQAIVITLSDLLRNASDADGDPLHVNGLASSSGKLAVRSDGSWLFAPARGDETNVSFSFAVSDGSLSVDQTALLDLVALPQEIIEGTEGNDTIVGTPLWDVIDARGGHDIVIGLDGDDVIHGGSGNDRIVAGDGNDVVDAGDGDDVVFAGGGNDVVSGGKGNDILFGEAGDDILRGQDGDDTISGGDGRDLISGGTGGDIISGDAGNDLIDGEEGADEIDGGSDDDFIIGGEGSDHAVGGTGNDVFMATSLDGDDQYSGGAGLDTYNIAGTSQDATVDLANGTARSADIGNDQLDDIENVVSGDGDDTIIGDSEANEITAGAGADTVTGNGG